MSGRNRSQWQCLGIGAVVLALQLNALTAQSPNAPSEWAFNNAQGGFCISYLMDPKIAAKLAPKEAVLAPAGRGEGLNPQVVRLLSDEPDFGKWIPATLCLELYRSVSINDQVVAQMKGNQPVLVVTHFVASNSYRGVPTESVMIGFYSDNQSLVNAGQRVGQAIEKATRQVIEREGADYPRAMIEFKGVKIRWEGGPIDEPRVLPTRTVSFGYTGERGIVWRGGWQSTVTEARTQVGSFIIEGKNDLAKALKTTPLRPIGPIEMGGMAKLSLTSTPKK